MSERSDDFSPDQQETRDVSGILSPVDAADVLEMDEGSITTLLP